MLDELKKGVVSAAYCYFAGRVTGSIHDQLVSLTSPGTDAKTGALREKNAVNRVLDSDIGRAGTSYALGLGTMHLPSPLASSGLVNRLGQTMRVNAIATVFTAGMKRVLSRRK